MVPDQEKPSPAALISSGRDGSHQPWLLSPFSECPSFCRKAGGRWDAFPVPSPSSPSSPWFPNSTCYTRLRSNHMKRNKTKTKAGDNFIDEYSIHLDPIYLPRCLPFDSIAQVPLPSSCSAPPSLISAAQEQNHLLSMRNLPGASQLKETEPLSSSGCNCQWLLS